MLTVRFVDIAADYYILVNVCILTNQPYSFTTSTTAPNAHLMFILDYVDISQQSKYNPSKLELRIRLKCKKKLGWYVKFVVQHDLNVINQTQIDYR
jgi:hypothetical protein